MRNTSKMLKSGMVLGHESVFFRSNVHKKYLYNCDYKIAADYDLLIRMYLDGISFKHIPIPIVRFMEDGISSKSRKNTYLETCKVRIDNGIIKNTKTVNHTIMKNAYRVWLFDDISPKWVRVIWNSLKRK